VDDSILKQRARSRVAVLDADFRIVLSEMEGDAIFQAMIPHARHLIERGEEFVEVQQGGGRFLVQVTPLIGEGAARFALMVEPRGTRRPLFDAAERFGLTMREVEVLEMIVDGASNREIAAALHIVEGTVQEHVRNICRKTQARRRGDLLARVFGIEEAGGTTRVPAEQGRDHP
jgi:DNA-binding CsgD family transcriptional regulator